METWILLVVLIVAVVVLGALYSILRDLSKLKKLKKTGVQGVAEILAIPPIDGGASNYILQVSLRVSLQGHSPYIVDVTTEVPQLRYRPVGTTVPVWVDPSQPTRVCGHHDCSECGRYGSRRSSWPASSCSS